MRYNILIGGNAGQGINKVSQIMSEVFNAYGYYTFNYREYQNLIRGGHNFNVLNLSNEETMSTDKEIDIILALDNNTTHIHKKDLKKNGTIIHLPSKISNKNLNLILSGSLTKYFGIPKDVLIKVIKKYFNNIEATNAVNEGYDSFETKIKLKYLKRKIRMILGSESTAKSAKNSGLNYYISYPMTPATGVMTEISKITNNNLKVFQAENEIAAVNMALGASFSGKITMVGTSGGGFDLMSETLSFQGISEIPLTVYLASRPGPATGIPTYTAQSDLNLALYAGHGEFARVVCAPGDPLELIEKTNELILLSEKFKTLSILLSDKHLSEGEFTTSQKNPKISQVTTNRKIPDGKIVKVSSYESNANKNATEDALIVKKNVDLRLEKTQDILEYLDNFTKYKLYKKKKSKTLVIGWGSTKGAILDAIKELNIDFLQILYLSPFPNNIEKELSKYSNLILIENNATAQLGDLIRLKTGIHMKNRILKYDGRPFFADELNKEIKRIVK